MTEAAEAVSRDYWAARLRRLAMTGSIIDGSSIRPQRVRQMRDSPEQIIRRLDRDAAVRAFQLLRRSHRWCQRSYASIGGRAPAGVLVTAAMCRSSRTGALANLFTEACRQT